MARTATLFAQVIFKRAGATPPGIDDFSPWLGINEDREGSIEDAFNMLASVANQNKDEKTD